MMKTTCTRCQRQIDATARICPFCNHEQSIRAEEDLRAVEVSSRPATGLPPGTATRPRWSSTKILVGAAVLVLLAATFAVGALFHTVTGSLQRQSGRASNAEDATETPAASPQRERSFGRLELQPVDPTETIGQAITSAPVPDPDAAFEDGYGRSDATALPAEQYARILEEARREQAPATSTGAIDPRTIVDQQPVRPPPIPRQQPVDRTAEGSPASSREGGKRTLPVPIHQPLPKIDRKKEIKEDGTLRFRLLVGRDGQVKEITVLQGMPGLTPKMISAIQTWRFKPGTVDGEPIESNFAVDISFKAP
ncbi:MAG TPA: energy transducer TonB [Thermoanaerobaculia bacterium]|nr:energy transducer TonB [Thermoanaerobaculia bacterium]